MTCSDQALVPLAERFGQTLSALCGIELSLGQNVQGGISIELVESDSDLGDELGQPPRTAGTSPSGTDPARERYGLEATTDGVRVWGTHPEGVFRGLTSLAQLIVTNCSDRTSAIPAIRIIDRPRFAWRGLSLDVARTFFGVDEVKSVIDLLSLYKLNVLHLHLSDNEGWRLEIKSRPQLTEVGASGATADRPGGFYTQDEFADLVRYAADRFVTIVPELDLPGHAGAAIRSYPELSPNETTTIAGFDLPAERPQPPRRANLRIRRRRAERNSLDGPDPVPPYRWRRSVRRTRRRVRTVRRSCSLDRPWTRQEADRVAGDLPGRCR